MLLAICILSGAVIVQAALLVRVDRRLRRAEERSRRNERKLDEFMAALDLITTLPQPPDDGGRHLRAAPLLAPVVWLGLGDLDDGEGVPPDGVPGLELADRN